MKPNKLAISVLLPLVFTTLACPTRPIDTSGTGGAAGSAAAGASGTAGENAAGGGSGALGGQEGPVGGEGGAAGSGASAAGAGGISLGGAAGGTAGVGSGGVAAAGASGSSGTGGAEPTCNPACNTTTQTCVGTKCLLNDGQMCSLASQCASHACTAFYLDQDGDGYGSGATVGFCGTTPPVGYTTQNGDCCDDPAHLAVSKLIHPGGGYQTASAGGVCGITWDYDCSGAVEQSAQQVNCPSFITCPNCSSGTAFATFVNFPDIYCGVKTEVCTTCGNTFSCSTGDSCGGADCSTITLGCR